MLLKRMMSTDVRQYYDIIITGGGMVGSVLACNLIKHLPRASILMIESGPKKQWDSLLIRNKDEFSNRVSALNTNSRNLLNSIDIWNTICSSRCTDVTQMKIWSNGSRNIATTFNAEDNGSGQDLAYIVENDVLIAAAMKKLDEPRSTMKVLHNKTVTEYNLPNDVDTLVKVKLNDGAELECSLLIGTDGVNSKVRQAMGVRYLSWNYNQQAVVGTLKISEVTENKTAWQKFVSTGPVALLPLDDNTCSLVWTTTPDRAKTLLSLSEEAFVDALNTVLWEEPISDVFNDNVARTMSQIFKTLNINENKTEVTPPTVIDVCRKSRASFPLGFGHAVNYVGYKTVLVGDAAHRVHPLAGQGVNLGFGDVEHLCRILKKYSDNGARIGDWRSLTDYETERQRINIPKLVGIDIIQKVAGHQWSPLLALTHVGIRVTDAVSPLKKCFINLAAV